MSKEARTARLGEIQAGQSVGTGNPDTVVFTAYVTDSKDRDRPILVELTSKGARMAAAQLLDEADKADAAVLANAVQKSNERLADSVAARRERKAGGNAVPDEEGLDAAHWKRMRDAGAFEPPCRLCQSGAHGTADCPEIANEETTGPTCVRCGRQRTRAGMARLTDKLGGGLACRPDLPDSDECRKLADTP